MAHRFNSATGRVEPKPSASERTWYRWRMRKGLEEKQDQVRFEKHQGVLSSIRESLIKMRNKK